MGVVYAAHDPRLSRAVALKLLRPHHATGVAQVALGARLREEARAMAQLTHPNVVAVHDVGEIGDQIFIAMELVDGETLAAWLASAPRGWREVVAVFLAAGQGLAAAHAAGIVHRDFKPENVFVGRDGRVRVGDFGLARLGAATASCEPDDDGSRFEDADRRCTVTGTLVGTLFYMAPEQLLGVSADERSDQFSFCVALHAALTRSHPFVGADSIARAESVMRGIRQPLPRPDPLPRRLRRALERGLSVEPTARFPSMKELLAELSHERSRAGLWAGVGAVASLGVAAAAWLAPPAVAAPCLGASRHWEGVWDDARAGALQTAFAATGLPYAARAAEQVQGTLGSYRDAWVAMHTAACEATRVRGEQSEELLDKRMLCLDARLRDARALVDRFVAADRDVVERAARAELSDIAQCGDLAELASQVPLPGDDATRERVSKVQGQLAEARAARLAGRAANEQARADALVKEARAIGYRPLEAEALFEQGWVHDARADFRSAKEAFSAAVWAAEAGRHDALAARAWTRLIAIEGERLGRYEESLQLRPRVTALLERLEGDDDAEAQLQMVSAHTYFLMDRVPEAKAEADRAHATLLRRYGPESLEVGEALHELGLVLQRADPPAARRSFERALVIRERILGAEHPDVASVLMGIAAAYFEEHRYDQSVAHEERARAILEAVRVPHHPDVARIVHNLAVSYRAQSREVEALALNRKALAIGEIAYGRDHPRYGMLLGALAWGLTKTGHLSEALDTFERALSLLRRHHSPDHRMLRGYVSGLAHLKMKLGRHREARDLFLGNLAIVEKVYGAESAELKNDFAGLGEAELELGRPARAVAALEHALHWSDALDADDAAEARFLLARALTAARRAPGRALALAQQARDHLRGVPLLRDRLREVQQWLARHERAPRLAAALPEGHEHGRLSAR